MTRKIRARIVNGALVPLEPLGIEEGAEVELDITSAHALNRERNSAKPEFRVVPFHSAFLPGMNDPKKMKQLLEDDDIEHFLRVQKYGRGT